MRLPAVAVRRPVATSMLFLAAAILGLISLARLEVSLLPEIRSEAIQVWVAWPDAGVPEIEEAVARPVEEAVMAATGVRGVRTRVVSGGATFRVEIHPGLDPDLVTIGLREKLDAVRWSFPPGVERPLVLGGAGEDAPAMVLALSSHDLPAAADWAESVLAPRLEQLDGVARALVVGRPQPEIAILPDQDRMRVAGLSVADLSLALSDANVESPGGALRQRGIRYALRVESRLRDAGDVADVVVTPIGGPPVRIGDVASVREGYAEAEGFARLDGEPAVGILVWRQAGKNLLRVADLVRDELALVGEDFPQLNVRVVADSSPFVREAVAGVGQAIALGGLLAFGILFAFLRDVRSPLLLAIALPTSLVVTLLALDLAGVSLNLMSLGGLALGVGMLVDNGIVCLENIHRLRRAGLDDATAAGRGAREIALPVLASTLTTCAVFVPLAFVPGAVGALCRDLAIAVSASLLVSWLVSMTLLPMLAARFPGKAPAAEVRPLYGSYRRVLDRALARPWTTLAVAGALVAVAGLVLATRPRDVLPELATDHLQVAFRLAPSTDVTTTDAQSRRLEEWLAARPEVDAVFATAGDVGAIDPGDASRRPNRGMIRVTLSDDGVRHRSALEADLISAFADEPVSLEILPDAPELAALWSGGGATLTCEVAGPDERRSEELAREIADRAETGGDAAERRPLRVVAAEREPRIRLVPREDVLWRFGLSEAELVPAVEAATSGHEATRITRFDEEVPVVVRRPLPVDPRGAEIVAGGRTFPVDQLFVVRTELAPATLLREDQARVASIRWDGPLPEADGIRRALESALSEVDLPAGYTATFGGAWREMRGTVNGLLRAFALSAGLVLLVLAAQFESVRLPLLVFAAVPLALPGVAVALLLAGSTVNAMAGVGLVVLVGIAVNDAILKVDLYRRFREEGQSVREASLRAGKRRYRPIVMTTVTTVLGLLPLFLGRGAELRAPLAATVIGGLVAATVLTLVILPVLFERLAGLERVAPRQASAGVLAEEAA